MKREITLYRWLHQITGLFLLFIIPIFLILACSSHSSQVTDTLPRPPSTSTRLIKHAMGETLVPTDPHRVVTLDGSGLENALTVGIKPIGTVLNGTINDQPAFLRDRLNDVEFLGSFAQPSLEKILFLKPDLILGTTGGTELIYDQLSQIAPTVLATFEKAVDWKKILKLHAETLGKAEAAQQFLDHYDQRLATFREKMGHRLKEIEVSVVRIYPDSISLYQKGGFSSGIMEDAGLVRPPSQQEEGVQRHISKELIHEADGDILFLWTYADDYGNTPQSRQQAIEKLKADPLWLQLDAVRQGKVYEVSDYWIGYGPLAADAVIDDLFKYLLPK